MSEEPNGQSLDASAEATLQRMACPFTRDELLNIDITPEQIDALSFAPLLQVQPGIQMVTPTSSKDANYTQISLDDQGNFQRTSRVANLGHYFIYFVI